MSIVHRIKMALGLGPKFILAEPGTDPLNEPSLYRVRRRRGGVAWYWWLMAFGTLASIVWYFWGYFHRG